MSLCTACGGRVEVLPHSFLPGYQIEMRVELHTPATLSLEAEPPISIVQGAGSAPELVWTVWRREKCIILPGNRTTILRVSSRQPNEFAAYKKRNRVNKLISKKCETFQNTVVYSKHCFQHVSNCYGSSSWRNINKLCLKYELE